MSFVEKENQIIFMDDFSSSGCTSKTGVKERQILTPLPRKTHAEAKQQDLSQLCTAKYCVQLVHSWTDVLGLVYFLLPLH